MIVVTGAAGFIGSNLVKSLNSQGFSDIIAVDNLRNGEKFINLRNCQIDEFLDKENFRELIKKNFLPKIDVIFHQGACSNTMETNGNYILDNNYRFTLELLRYCQLKKIPFLYASSAAVYGDTFSRNYPDYYEKPLNVYGYSKLLCDQFLKKQLNSLTAPVVSMRYFNVYGKNEKHKNQMASIIFQSIKHFQSNGYIKLFSGNGEYQDGCQMRDFIFVNDIISVNMHFWNNSQHSGIFDCGTGVAQSFNRVAKIIINSFQKKRKLPILHFKEMLNKGLVRYVEFPESLKGAYQNYTKANTVKLRATGFKKTMIDISIGIYEYIEELASC